MENGMTSKSCSHEWLYVKSTEGDYETCRLCSDVRLVNDK
jgi:hypothetical protein